MANDEDEDDDEDDDDGVGAHDAGAESILNLLRCKSFLFSILPRPDNAADMTLAGARTGLLTRAQLVALMRDPDLTSVLFQDDPDSDAEFLQWPLQRRRTPKDPGRFPKIPSENGLKLMRSGVFGANDHDLHRKKHLAQRMLNRELAIGNHDDRRRNNALITQVWS